jgi:hypothetical protein
MKKVRFQIMLKPQQLEALEAISKEEDEPVSLLVCNAIGKLLKDGQHIG